jgi:hypothetical protein
MALYLSISCDLKLLFAHGSRNSMRVKIPLGHDMLQSYQISTSHQLDRSRIVIQLRSNFIIFLDDPFIIVVLVSVSSYLLLFRPNPFRIKMPMGVEITTSGSLAFNCYISTVSNLPWHTSVVKRISYELRLESGTVKSISVPTSYKNSYMKM